MTETYGECMNNFREGGGGGGGGEEEEEGVEEKEEEEEEEVALPALLFNTALIPLNLFIITVV